MSLVLHLYMQEQIQDDVFQLLVKRCGMITTVTHLGNQKDELKKMV